MMTYGLRRDDMPLFLLVETGDAFNGHIIGLCRTRSKDNIFRISTNKIGNMLWKVS